MGLIVRQAGLLISLMVLRSWAREKESEEGGWGEGVGSMCRGPGRREAGLAPEETTNSSELGDSR